MTGRAFVTGCAGFLGSHFVRSLTREGLAVLGFDALTYAGDMAGLRDALDGPDFEFVRGDLVDLYSVRSALLRAEPDIVVHFAAESHVTRGERDAERFNRTNFLGTQILLEESTRGGVTRFINADTEVIDSEIGNSIVMGDCRISEARMIRGSLVGRNVRISRAGPSPCVQLMVGDNCVITLP